MTATINVTFVCRSSLNILQNLRHTQFSESRDSLEKLQGNTVTDILQDLAAVLSTQWETVENTYVTDAKFVFHQVRYERENVYRYFYQIR